MDDISVYCPKCSWEPDGKPYWRCGCENLWDTFSTGGRCPACGKVWEETQCIQQAGGCGSWSPHLDWYHGLTEIVEILKAEIKAGWQAAPLRV